VIHEPRPCGSAPQIQIYADGAALVDATVEIILSDAALAIERRGRFTIALSGGSTPRAVYERLGDNAQLAWDQIEFCFGDERAVPPDHPDSNARMVRESLLRHGRGKPERVHRIPAELPPAQAAAEYERSLRKLFPGEAWPTFDLMLLGLGADAHTASLFPGSPALAEGAAWVVDNWVEKLNTHRITLTFPVLNAARHVVFMVAGADKAPALRAALADDSDVNTAPARGVRPQPGSLTYLVDRAAAALL
jgi:6-phosphogluconolactonase